MDDLEVKPGVVIPGAELTFSTSRASGPGGQHVNTTDSRVTVRFTPATSSVDERIVARWIERLGPRLTSAGELVLHCDTHRSQLRNREEVRERLAATLRTALHVPKTRRATRPSRGSQRRRIKAKKERGQKKQLRGRVRED